MMERRLTEGKCLLELGVGYAWEEGRTKNLVFPWGSRISQLSLGADGRWNERNLSRDAHVPVPPRIFPGIGDFVADASFTGYSWFAGHSQQVAYVGTDGHIHELYAGLDGDFHHVELSDRSRAPLPSSMPSNSMIVGYAWEEGRSKQIVYLDDGGAIHELYCHTDSDWKHANLTTRTGCPSLSSSHGKWLVGYAWPEGRTKQVVYVGDDRHVYELSCGVDSDWSFADLTTIAIDMETGIAGAPNAHPSHDWFSACAWPQGGTKQVAYVGADHNIYELFTGLDGVWRFTNLTEITSGALVR